MSARGVDGRGYDRACNPISDEDEDEDGLEWILGPTRKKLYFDGNLVELSDTRWGFGCRGPLLYEVLE